MATKGTETYSFTTDVDTDIFKLWIYLTNDLYLVKAIDGRKIREGRNLFVGAVEMTYVR